jgi:hypothetical protein
MVKIHFFLKAMQAGEYRRRAWVISAFTLVAEGPEDWKKDPYPYRIVQTPTGHFFVDPENNLQLTKIADTQPGVPIYRFQEKVFVNAFGNDGSIPNLFEDGYTTYGNILANFTVLIYPFGQKIRYINERFNARKIEDIIVHRLKDNPAEGEEPVKLSSDTDPIYVDEYLKFADAMFSLVAYAQLCVPAATEKSMVAAPGVLQLKAKLLEENKDRLHDPATIAKIDAELVAFDKAYLKGDRSEGFLITKKSTEIVRKKLFSMHGAETGLSNNTDVDLIANSLAEGWDINKFPTMNNSLRTGSYSRGKQTELGGDAVKWLMRASSNLAVTVDDCGSKLGVDMVATDEDKEKLVGFTAITDKGLVKIEEENVGAYLGKRVVLRSPMYCQLDKTDYCKTCIGDRLANSPHGLATAVSAMGSSFLAIYMSAAHAKALQLAKMDYRTALA